MNASVTVLPQEAQAVRQAYDGLPTGQPQPSWVRGTCPECGEPVISNAYYAGPGNYIAVWQCWSSLGTDPACSYRRIL